MKFFVTHGGLGSMIDLVKQKVPAICTPRFSDQFLNSAKMEKLSIGISVNDFTIEDIEQAIDKIQPNYKKYQKNLEQLADELKRYENSDILNNFVEKIATRKEITIQRNLKFQLNSSRYHYIWKLTLLF